MSRTYCSASFIRSNTCLGDFLVVELLFHRQFMCSQLLHMHCLHIAQLVHFPEGKKITGSYVVNCNDHTYVEHTLLT
jgi:hypothetical protein